MSDKDYIEITVVKRVKIGTLKTRKTNLTKKLTKARVQYNYWGQEQAKLARELHEVEEALSQFPKPEIPPQDPKTINPLAKVKEE